MIGGHPIVYVLLSQLFRHFIAFVSLIHGSIESHDVRGHFLKQAKAADKLKEYLDLLAEYKQQNDMNTQESEWIGEELDWASKMLSKISLL